HGMGTPQHVRHTLLVYGIPKALVGRVTIVRQVAGPAPANGFFQDFGTAASVDGETRGPVVSDPSVEPDGLAAKPPTGFIGREVRGVAEVLFDFLVGELESPARSQHGLSTSAACQVDAVGAFQQVSNLAIGKAAVLVEIGDRGLGIGADLAGGGTDGIGSLQAMTAAHTTTATAASSLVNADFSANGLDGNLFLKLEIDLVILRDVAAAMGTAVGQERFEGFVDVLVGRRGAMAMLAIVGTAGPGSGPRLFLGLAPRKRCGLSLASALRLFELSLETIAFGLET